MKSALMRALKDLDGLGETAIQVRILGMKPEGAEVEEESKSGEMEMPEGLEAAPAMADGMEAKPGEDELDEETKAKLLAMLSK